MRIVSQHKLIDVPYEDTTLFITHIDADPEEDYVLCALRLYNSKLIMTDRMSKEDLLSLMQYIHFAHQKGVCKIVYIDNELAKIRRSKVGM